MTSLCASKEEVLERVQKTVSAQLGIEATKIKEDSSFTGDLGADSLDLVEMVMAFESDFDIEIKDENAGKIVTVGDAVRNIIDLV